MTDACPDLKQLVKAQVRISLGLGASALILFVLALWSPEKSANASLADKTYFDLFGITLMGALGAVITLLGKTCETWKSLKHLAESAPCS
ncbi:MAG: hypothetical protein AAF415_07770 [Pseudomonadota bacterium]